MLLFEATPAWVLILRFLLSDDTVLLKFTDGVSAMQHWSIITLLVMASAQGWEMGQPRPVPRFISIV
jgi:hypothetical protein